MNIKQLFILFVFFIGATGNLLAQDFKLPEIIPPSPNTAALGKYGDIPIGLFTGSPQINIPMCELKTKNISVPVTLRYSSNGVRVDEYSSNVGMGWDLSVGGVVTRHVNDDPDENPQRVMPDFNTQLITDAMENFLISQTIEDGNGTPSSYDYQPDVYSFNFGGYSGQFYLDNNSTSIANRTPILFEPAPLKIKLNTGGGNLSGFYITDPNGIQYTFSTKEKSMNRSSCVQLPAHVRAYKITNAWHLTKIKYPSGDYVEFSYELKEISFDNGVSQSVTSQTNLNATGCNIPSYTPCLYGTANISPYLKEINAYTGDNKNLGKITFNYSHKSGMPTGMDKLDKISLFDAKSKLIKEQIFEYQPYVSSGGNRLPPLLQKPYHKKRFFLSKVTEKNSTKLSKPAHVFDYNNPEQLPSRFSYSQDYWGYYNGKFNQNLIDTKTLEPYLANPVIANDLKNFQAANREPSFSSGIKGSLKKITYPTKGSSTLTYNPHSYARMEAILPPITYVQAKGKKLTEGTIIKYATTVSIPFDQKSTLSFTLSKSGVPIPDDLGGGGNIDPTPLYFHVQVQDMTENKNIEICQNINGACYSLSNNPFKVTIDNFKESYYVNLKKGHTYRVKIIIRRNHTAGSASLNYYAKSSVSIMTNKEVGGLRIAKVETNDGNGNIQTKKYHYTTLDDLSLSSGNLTAGKFTSTVSQFNTVTNADMGGLNQCRTITFSSNSAYPIYGVYHIGYNSVIEEDGTNFSEGGIINTFQTQRIGLELSEGWGMYIQGTPQSNFFGYGRPWEKLTFKKVNSNYITLSKETNVYKHDPHFDKKIQAYNVRKHTHISAGGIGSNLESRIKQYDISGYKKKRQWHYLEKKTDSIFDQNGLNPIVNTTDYYYGNPKHLQVTRTKTTTSDDVPLITKIYYPDDVVSTSSLGHDALTPGEKGAIDKLKASSNKHRLAEPIQTEVYKDLDNDGVEEPLELLSLQRTLFNNNLNPLPKNIQTLKGVYNSSTNTLKERLIFHSYYSNGNIKEVSKTNGTHIVYIWGYNEQYPIAKIENATYSDVPTSIYNSIVSKSDLDDDRCLDSGNCDEKFLRTELNKLRNSALAPKLSNALITTYTYDPLIGITSVTDPKGYTTFYDYDDLNRLEFVRDAKGNLLSENKYNYKN